MPGCRFFTSRARSKYAVPGRSGWMPPCMQISVAPAAHASSTRSPTCCHRQRVGVGVGAPLGERAEPAAGVADVGEVDVPVDDVGDVVADDVARGRRRPGAPERLEVGAVGAQQRQVLARRRARPGPARRAAARPAPRGRRRASAVECPSRRRSVRVAQLRPVAVDGVEVAAPVRRPPDGVDLDVQVDPARRRPRLVRLLPGQPDRDRGPRRPARRRRPARTRAGAPAGPATARAAARTAAGRRAARAARSPASAVSARQLVDVRPRPLGVDVVGRQRRDAAPVVDAGAQQQAELGGVRQVRRRLHPRLRAEHQPGDGDGGDVLLQLQVVVRPASPCRGFARKFWTMTSCTCPCRCADGPDLQDRRRPARRSSRRCRAARRW